MEWFWSATGDERGWILACVSGIACVFGCCIICLDIITRCIPWCRGFDIRKSPTFLAGSLGLSFGVMIFSSLYSILPEASGFMRKGGINPMLAKFLSIVYFLVGVCILAALSELLHWVLPSSIITCGHHGQHSHHDHHREEHKVVEQTEGFEEQLTSSDDGQQNFHHHHHYPHCHHNPHNRLYEDDDNACHQPHNDDGLHRLRPHNERPRFISATGFPTRMEIIASEATPLLSSGDLQQSPSLGSRLTNSSSDIVRGNFPLCGGIVTSSGFSETRTSDGQCDVHAPRRKLLTLGKSGSPLLEDSTAQSPPHATSLRRHVRDLEWGITHADYSNTEGEESNRPTARRTESTALMRSHGEHNRVHRSEFLSIGVQTSIAIALHKLPEGFITFATNHANAKLGFAVFLALAIHNVSEGFAMSLPLFLAFKSRPKAIIWASCLGGLSQPAGALLAWVWLKARHANRPLPPPPDRGPNHPNSNHFVYGVLFAITAGIMCNVALQLFAQSVKIYHNMKVPLGFAFLGMAVLGLSFSVAEGV